MEENKNKQEEPKKLTYEQLYNVAHQLSNQNVDLRQKLSEANLINMFKRLDYLFKVLEMYKRFDDKFVYNCTKEIVEFMTPSDEEKDNTTTQE